MMGAMDAIRPARIARREAAEPSDLAERFAAVRALSETLAAPLSDADATLQSMPDASPAKWHLAHTTWFWETFLLRDHRQGYAPYDERYAYLFNSYYEVEGPRHARPSRGMLSRPSTEEILAWRAQVDAAMTPLLDRAELVPLIELGLAHEQQHQELLLTDIKHSLFQNPLGPAMFGALAPARVELVETGRAAGWIEHPGGKVRIGHRGPGFAFDNEGPAHDVLLQPFALAARLVTNAEWADFVADGGYNTPTLWLSDGWAWVQAEGVDAPLYWRDGEHFTHCGWQPRDPAAPVAHISYYEADAFAQWARARLPTECEWEALAASDSSAAGTQLDGAAEPLPRGQRQSLFGDC